MGVTLARRGHDVSVLARGATLGALHDGPWRLTRNGETLEASVRASADAAALGLQDIVIVSVKGPALAAVTPAIATMSGPDAIVIPAMNGVPWWFLLTGAGELPPSRLASVDPDGAIERAIPLERVIGCVVHASASSPSPGTVQHTGGNKLILGEPRGGMSERLETVCAILEDAGFEAVRSGHVQQDIWYKLWGNMTMNPISAITGATCDRILDDPLVLGLALRVMAEAAEIGTHIGCTIRESGRDRIAITRKLGAFKTSMLQDVEAGRPIEVDALLAAPREIAEKLSLPVPNIEALLGLTRLFAQTHGLV